MVAVMSGSPAALRGFEDELVRLARAQHKSRAYERLFSVRLTVAAVREHHLQLHRQANEAAWWANFKIAPLQMAKDLWTATLRQDGSSVSETTVMSEWPNRQGNASSLTWRQHD